MSLNGINAGYAATAATAIEKVQKADKATASSKESAYKSEAGATYETTVSASSKRTKNAALVAQLKADSEKRSAQMQSLVTQMFQKQGIAIGTADDMWKVLASGNFTADADTIAQAKEDISEDGYWGVNQTSDRIFSARCFAAFSSSAFLAALFSFTFSSFSLFSFTFRSAFSFAIFPSGSFVQDAVSIIFPFASII